MIIDRLAAVGDDCSGTGLRLFGCGGPASAGGCKLVVGCVDRAAYPVLGCAVLSRRVRLVLV